MMNYLNDLSQFVQGYLWATLLFPVEYYFAKPVIQRVWNDVVYYANPVLSKVTGKTASVQLP